LVRFAQGFSDRDRHSGNDRGGDFGWLSNVARAIGEDL
jgi:hypothetical protein